MDLSPGWMRVATPLADTQWGDSVARDVARTMTRQAAVPRGELARQARVARTLGSPFVGAVLDAGDRHLHRAPKTAALIAGWPHDRAAAALAMRFNAALHALARRDADGALGRLYRSGHGDLDGVIGDAMAEHDDFVTDWMQHPPQTNEVGRAGAIAAALMAARRELGLPFEVLEIGSSCGLTLNLAHYSYDLGGTRGGMAASAVHIAPTWRGGAPAFAPIEVVAARGVDLSPLDARDAATRERLLAFVWADQPWRTARLEQALKLAGAHLPRIDRGDAASWIGARLAEEQAPGTCRVILHSMVLQYIAPYDRRTINAAIAAAGAHATPDRPLAQIGFEWTPDRREVQLSLTCWPTGGTRVLATCHAYGEWVEWRGDSAPN